MEFVRVRVSRAIAGRLAEFGHASGLVFYLD
jgi:hypothetical protein